MKIYLLLLILAVTGSKTFAQLITVKASLEKDTIMIGEQIGLKFTVEKEAGLNVRFPDFADTLTSDLEILDSSEIDTTFEDKGERMEKLLKITGFTEGIVQIPSQFFPFSGNGISDTVHTSPLFLVVLSPAVDTTQAIRPIKPPVNTPVNFAEIYPWLLRGFLGLLGLSLIIAIIWMLLHREKLNAIFNHVKEEPAHVVAFRELDRLKEEKLPEQGRVKEFYSRLTEIIRRYIEKQYGIPAMETTTGEILGLFKSSNPDDPMLDEMLENLLQLGDLVKFAKQDPLPVENQTNLNNAYFFIQKTYPYFITPGTGEKKEEKNDVEPDETFVGNE
ncbi:MAG: hypothetical protein ACOYXB_15295 [Bacteroidota bacterium]